MATKKKRVSKSPTAAAVPELTKTEQDLLSHMEQGYQLETDSLGREPVLRKLKDNETYAPRQPIAVPWRHSKNEG